MIAGFKIIRMIFDVAFAFAAIFKKHLAADVMEGAPVFVAAWRSEFVFSLDHFRFADQGSLDFGSSFQYLLFRLSAPRDELS